MTRSTQRGQRTEKMLLNIPASDMRMVSTLVSSGRYSTKSEVVRSALKEFLYNRERMERFDEFAKEVGKRVDELGLTRKDLDRAIEEVKDETRRDVERMLRDLGAKKPAKIRPGYMKKLRKLEKEGTISEKEFERVQRGKRVKAGPLKDFKKRYGLR